MLLSRARQYFVLASRVIARCAHCRRHQLCRPSLNRFIFLLYTCDGFEVVLLSRVFESVFEMMEGVLFPRRRFLQTEFNLDQMMPKGRESEAPAVIAEDIDVHAAKTLHEVVKHMTSGDEGEVRAAPRWVGRRGRRSGKYRGRRRAVGVSVPALSSCVLSPIGVGNARRVLQLTWQWQYNDPSPLQGWGREAWQGGA